MKEKGGLGYLAKKTWGELKKQVHGWINAYREFGEEWLLRKRKKQSYSFQFKIDAIELYQTSDPSYREVANHLGINQPALVVNWMEIFRSKGLDRLSKMKGCSSILSRKEVKEEISKLMPEEHNCIKELRKLRK